MKDGGAKGKPNHFGEMISNCRYLLCVPDGFYGLEAYWKDDHQGNRIFSGFMLHDIGSTLPILGKDFNFKFCSFHVIGGGDETTLFLTVKEKGDGGKCHYLYLNESSLDETYGFTEIDSVVADQLIVHPSEVFSKVESIRELDTVNIAMTDYGFWDVEENQTNNITYSYRNGKSYENEDVPEFNNDTTKLVDPTIQLGDAVKYCEYSHVDDGTATEYGIDRLWNATDDGNWYECEGVKVDDENKKYREKVIINRTELPFYGATENFAIYD